MLNFLGFIEIVRLLDPKGGKSARTNATRAGGKEPTRSWFKESMEKAIVSADIPVDGVSDQQCIGKRIRQISFQISNGQIRITTNDRGDGADKK
jgi:hypothetical protein